MKSDTTAYVASWRKRPIFSLSNVVIPRPGPTWTKATKNVGEVSTSDGRVMAQIGYLLDFDLSTFAFSPPDNLLVAHLSDYFVHSVSIRSLSCLCLYI